MAEAWPVDVPSTLWTYRDLKLGAVPEVPMMGVTFASGFLVSCVVGGLFLVFFAWDRFMNQRTQDQRGAYRVLSELTTRDLGGGGALRKAYMIYATVILIIYVSLTFFGKLIFSLTNQLPVAGIQVDVTRIHFDQPAWPLTVAFGLAGLGPLLPPVRIAEDWLRERAYRAVGIPTRIQKTTRRILATLDNPLSETAGSSNSAIREKYRELRARLETKTAALEKLLPGTWIATELGRDDRRDEFLALIVQLELLVGWARRARGAWPGIEVSTQVRTLEEELLASTENLLDDFHGRLKEKEADTIDDAAGQGGDKGVAARRKVYLADTLIKMRQSRAELAAILAVYIERDPVELGPVRRGDAARSSEIRDEALDGLLFASEPDPVSVGPEAALGLAILALAPVYGAFVWQGIHPVFAPSADASAPVVILATTGLETLRLTLTLWLPILAAFSIRQFLLDEDKWIRRSGDNQGESLRQMSRAMGTALLAGFVGLIVLALLWAFMQSVSESRFKGLLMAGRIPFLLYYPTMIAITAPAVWAALAGADARAEGQEGRGVLIGLLGAALVFGAQYFHVALWYRFQGCVPAKPFFTDLFDEGCFGNYGGLDFFVYPILTFLTAAVFGDPEQRSRRRTGSSTAEGESGLEARPGRRAAAALLGALFVLTSSSAALAGSDGGGRWEGPLMRGHGGPIPVVLGFRADAEPFSFEKADGTTGAKTDGRRYSGYVANLCYEIFSGSNFRITEREVTAENRFQQLVDGDIDVLCDPVTMRLSDESRRGIYSPIIFASGVSYLRIVQRQVGPRAQLAFVEGSTAEKVAKAACRSDLISIVPPASRDNLPIICDTSWAASEFVWTREHGGTLDDRSRTMDQLRAATALQIRWAKSDIASVSAMLREQICGTQDAKCQDDVTALIDCATGGSSCSESGASSEESALAALKDRHGDPDGLEDAITRKKQWEAVEKFLAREDCGESTCLDELTHLLIQPGYDPHCKVLDGYEATKFESIFYRFCPQVRHEDAISWLCRKRFSSETNLVYMGDRDIIVGKLRTWQRNNGACPVENPEGAENLTYEPYALLFREGRPDLAGPIQRGVYRFFSSRTHAIEAFRAFFPGKTMSEPLAYLFLLNAVEEEEDAATMRGDKIPERPIQ